MRIEKGESMTDLVIMRHGESTANRDNLFTGWSDVPLTEKGIEQAYQAGDALARHGFEFSHVHTSMLQRAIVTANIVLDEIDQLWLPMTKSWRLNERHYGALRGLNKKEVAEKYGQEKFKEWRRSYKAIPLLLDEVEQDRRYDRYGTAIEPLGESLEMAYYRLLPYWEDEITPRLLEGKNQLVVAHGSTLRALIKFLEKISDDEIDQVEVENSVPIHYVFDEKLHILKKEELL